MHVKKVCITRTPWSASSSVVFTFCRHVQNHTKNSNKIVPENEGQRNEGTRERIERSIPTMENGWGWYGEGESTKDIW